MIRGMHDFPSINSSFEWIYNPNIVQNKYTVNRNASLASGIPGQRFGVNPETRLDPPLSLNILGAAPGVMIGSPLSRDWIPFGGGYIPLFVPSVREEFPQGFGKYARGGFRTNTTLGGYNFGISYFHTQEYNPVIKMGDIVGGFRDVILSHPNKDIFGAYLNKNLSVIPGVIRADVIYVPNQPFNTFDQRDSDAIVRRDYVKYMLAYDLNSFLYFSWHKTAPFDITFEHVGEWIPKNKNIQYASVYNTEVKQWNPSFNMRISTNWFYNMISTELVAGYIPWGRSGLLMPAVKYTPPFLNKQLSFELKYINIFGKNKFEGLGILRTKDMVILTSQFNW
jgi:hypothetical protein